MNASTLLRLGFFCLIIFIFEANAFQKAKHEELPNFDKRRPQSQEALQKKHAAARAQLEKNLPKLQVDFDEITGSPKIISAAGGFLSGKKASGRGISLTIAAEFPSSEPHRATKAFLKEHKALFGHGPEVLTNAKIKSEFVTPHNGMRTVVWQQQLNDISVFEGLLTSHTTKDEELVKISSHFLADPATASKNGARNQLELNGQPGISAQAAISIAANNIGEMVVVDEIISLKMEHGAADKRQQFKARPLKGETQTHLVWLPMNGKEMRLCWQIIFTSATRSEAFKSLVDAQTGEVLLRHGLTEYISDASYRVFTSDSPTPFSPGHLTPLSTQPSPTTRELVVTNAFDTNASPNGWINDGVNETAGNNVNAHLDLNANDIPDLPRPQGSPNRVFDFPLDLEQSPSTYRDASVVQLFFLCNWYHDKLYELGFTEGAGNFQLDNFARGGLGNDPVEADAQDGTGFNNANFTTLSDGSSGRMQMYIFNGPTPDRDGSFDAEIVFHEYTHGLSNRRVGNGVGLSALQSRGMGEGWSDFYGLALLAEAGDDVNGNFAIGGYATFQLAGLTENYYFGIRRYPYSTDLTKNPLTFKDIDPAQASSHPGIPKSSIVGGGSANQVHNQGEVWCSALWEVRANLINKHGFVIGNQLVLQLVTDGMNLSPANPNFLQARDAIIQADLVNNSGANYDELWAGFAKRGMGAFATSPSSSTTAGVAESFLVPDDLLITPLTSFAQGGSVGGPFSPLSQILTLTNTGGSAMAWGISAPSNWLTFSEANGILTPGGPASTVTIALTSVANTFPIGVYTHLARFTNLTSGVIQTRPVTLKVWPPDLLTEFFQSADNDLDNKTFTFTPDGSVNFYSVCRKTAASFPTDPAGGTSLFLGDDDFKTVTLPPGSSVKIYGSSNNIFYIGSNGYITFDRDDITFTASLSNHFDRPRISGLFADLDPTAGGQVSWKQMSNRVVVTYSNVRQYNTVNANSFQIEMFFNGIIQVTYLQINTTGGLAGLSGLSGGPSSFTVIPESDFSAYGVCPTAVTLNAFLAGGTLTIEFNSVVGATYQIQYSDDFVGWTPVSPNIPGTGSLEQWVDATSPPPSGGARFFRVVTL